MSTAENKRRFSRHNGLLSQQRRLRHLRSLSARNISQSQCGTDALMETYFTLHATRSSEAFYTSEKIQDSLNPTWRSFDLCRSCPEVNTHRSLLFVKVWGGHDSEVKLIIEWKVDLKGLYFVGEKIHKDGVKYQPNSILFGMFDGFYSSADNVQESSRVKPKFMKTMDVEQSSAVTTYNTYALIRLNTAQRAIKQTEATVGKVRSCIVQKLSDTSNRTKLCSGKEAVELRLQLLKEEIASHRRRLEKERKESDLGRQQVEQAADHNRLKWEELDESRRDLVEQDKLLAKNKEIERRVVSTYTERKATLVRELSSIYPITQLSTKFFAICSAQLPNAESNIQMAKDDPTISTALGHTGHLILMISRFLQVPLRYGITFYGSRSTIHDHITQQITDKDRDFPLYTRGKEKFHFNYAVYLLNRNIAQLRLALGLPTSDLRLTLPNLQTLLEHKWGIASDVSANALVSSPPTRINSSKTQASVGIQASMSPNPPKYSSDPNVPPESFPNSPPPPYHISQAAEQGRGGPETAPPSQGTNTTNRAHVTTTNQGRSGADAAPLSQGTNATHHSHVTTTNQGRGGPNAAPPSQGTDATHPAHVTTTNQGRGGAVERGEMRDSGVVVTEAEESGTRGVIRVDVHQIAGVSDARNEVETGMCDGERQQNSEVSVTSNGEGMSEEEEEEDGEGRGTNGIGIGQPNYNSGDALSQDSLDLPVEGGRHIARDAGSSSSSSISSPTREDKGGVVITTGSKTSAVNAGASSHLTHNQSNSNNAHQSPGESAKLDNHSSVDCTVDTQASGSKVKGHVQDPMELTQERNAATAEVPFMDVDHMFGFDDITLRADALADPSTFSSFRSNNSVSVNKERSSSKS